MNPNEVAPLVVPATVVEPGNHEGVWWLEVEFDAAGFGSMPQMYREEEIIGLWGPDLRNHQ